MRFVSRAGQDLPAEFSPPDVTAERIAALNTIAEREALWVRIPAEWQPMTGVLTVHAIARRIYAIPARADRQAAIDAVPGIWRSEVKKLVVSFWNTRHLRAEAQDEQRAAA